MSVQSTSPRPLAPTLPPQTTSAPAANAPALASGPQAVEHPAGPSGDAEPMPAAKQAIQASPLFDAATRDTGYFQNLKVPSKWPPEAPAAAGDGAEDARFEEPGTRARSNAFAIPVAKPLPVATPVAIPVAAPVQAAAAASATQSPAKPAGPFAAIGGFFSRVGAAVRNGAARFAQQRAQQRADKMSDAAVAAYVQKAAPRLLGLSGDRKYEAIRKDPVLWRALEAQCAKEYSTDQLNVMKASQRFADNPLAGWKDYQALMNVVRENDPNIQNSLRASLDSMTEADFAARGRDAVLALNAEMSGLLVKDPIKRMLTR